MPDQSEDTGRILIEAAGWIKDRDPKSADRFYKALVERCSNTSLGRVAADMHWFPLLEPGERP